MVLEKMLFKCISDLELWQPFCSAEHNHLFNFGRGYYEKQLCEIILNYGKWFRRAWLSQINIWTSGGPPVQLSQTTNAILKEGIIGNIHVKLYEIWTNGSGGDIV